MASMRIGTRPVTPRVGARHLSSARVGTRVVWAGSKIADTFNYDDELTASGLWTAEVTGSYPLVATSGYARVGIPDGLISLSSFSSRVRYVGDTSTSADGYVEVRVAGTGSSGRTTQVWRRYSNDGSGQYGVGIALRDSNLGITRRVAGTETVEMIEGSSFQIGDIIRLRQNGTLHSLYRNGSFVGEWDDGGTVPAAATNRSIGLSMAGSKDLLGPRRFAPSLDYIEAN